MSDSANDLKLEYISLDDEQKEFRLLRISDSCDGVIKCGLSKFSLNDAGIRWTALSYRWGSEEAIYPIKVNGRSFLVRPNLYAFLAQLARAQEKPLADVSWIFIDAICIHQSNMPERAVQVGLMRDIYQRADLVIASLSEKDSPGVKVTATWHDLEQPALYNTYWTRMWVVQEIFLARSLIFLFDKRLYTAQELLDSVKDSIRHGMSRGRRTPTTYLSDTSILTGMSATYSQERMDRMTPLMAGQLLYCLGRNSSTVPAFPVHEAINTFSSQRCAVTHDKVFALLGIMRCHIKPDYTMPIIVLYAQILTEYLISLGLEKGSTSLRMLRRHLVSHGDGNFGQAILTILGVDPRNLTNFLVTRAVMSFFAIEEARDVLHTIVIGKWLKFCHFDDESNHPFKKIWWKTIGKNNTQVLYDRSQVLIQELSCQLSELRGNDATLTEPVEGVSQRISEWEAMALSSCDTIWMRYLEDKSPVTASETRDDGAKSSTESVIHGNTPSNRPSINFCAIA